MPQDSLALLHAPHPRDLPEYANMERLSPAAWAQLAADYGKVARGEKTDTRHGGDMGRWRSELTACIPLAVHDQSLANAARASGCPELLRLVYCSITPVADVEGFKSAPPVDAMTFEALCHFRDRFGIKGTPDENALLLRYVLAQDAPNLLKRLAHLDEQDILSAWKAQPDIFEWTGPRLAPDVAAFMKGWAQFSRSKLLYVFLQLCKQGHAKSLNACLAAGLEVFADKAEAYQKAPVFHPQGKTACTSFPASLRALLEHLHPETPRSNHNELLYSWRFQSGALENILTSSRDRIFPTISRSDWADFHPGSSDLVSSDPD